MNLFCLFFWKLHLFFWERNKIRFILLNRFDWILENCGLTEARLPFCWSIHYINRLIFVYFHIIHAGFLIDNFLRLMEWTFYHLIWRFWEDWIVWTRTITRCICLDTALEVSWIICHVFHRLIIRLDYITLWICLDWGRNKIVCRWFRKSWGI